MKAKAAPAPEISIIVVSRETAVSSVEKALASTAKIVLMLNEDGVLQAEFKNA